MNKALPPVWIAAILLLFFLSENNTLSVDEVAYLSWALDPLLFSSLEIGQKEPALVWLLKLVSFFSTSIQWLRLPSLIAAGLTLWFLFRIGWQSGVPQWVSALVALSSAYFVFYSRIALYEMLLVCSCMMFYWGVTLYAKNRSHSLRIIWLAMFFGVLIKASFMLVALTLPFAIVLASTGQGAFPGQLKDRKIRIGFLKDIVFCWTGPAAAWLLFALSGQWSNYTHNDSKFTVSTIEAIGNFIARLDYSIVVVAVDIGVGLLLALAVLSVALIRKKQYLAVLLGIGMVIFVFGVSSGYPRWLWARYMIVCLPVLLFVVFTFFRLSREKTRAIALVVILIGQLPAIYLTTFPLLYNEESVLWTADESDQHFAGEPGNLGVMDVYRETLSLGRNYKLSISCSPHGFDEWFCEYLQLAHPALFKGDRPELRLAYRKSSVPMVFEDIYFETSRTLENHPGGSYMYLYGVSGQ